MAFFKLIIRQPILPLMIGFSMLVGWLIPNFYDWSGADQSRSSPVILPTVISLALFGFVFCLSLPWLPLAFIPVERNQTKKAQFEIRTLLLATTLVAILLLVIKKVPTLWLGGILFAMVLAYILLFWIRFPSLRLATTSLIACMYLLFLWIVPAGQQIPSLLGLFGLPAFLPTLLAGGLMQTHAKELNWLSLLLTGLELVIGVSLIRLGPKRFFAYLVLLLITSIFGSFILNALIRM